ncbi:ribonucleases P/MRP protein subunit POP1-like isoform X3 [Oncorhynchus kisutch]|uniref:ribonucleases P/MRP protein subunit POP1-like isoform X3 n=1 Tax=Oncorhynchus kisutch TaxID=8019 RepID=UPI0012DC0617|nr:ribonucleases P/MRP protein subunit POP1-like isoform X3 [Oncorhynchus kisutch]
MSTAKHRMRDKKMRNQPINVTYSSQGSSHWRNGGGTPTGRGHDLSPHPWGHGSSHSGHAQGGGWVRGHQREGHGGYPQALPTHITASAFAKARAAEVNAMLMAVTKTTGSSHVFGGLPKHMRRRAMSHNTKRLPCRLRDMANNMLEKSQKAGQKMKKEQSKSKSRKARRRHGNMLLEFNRRQRKNLWLETHIWHAKRFHVVKRWGYCLGDRPTYKCYRACYRAMSSHCLLQATGKSRPSPFWWPDHCRDDCNMSLHQQQAGVFNMLRGVYSTAEVPAGSVLGLTVDDPRLTLPNKRSKAVSDIRKAQGVNEERRRELMLKGIPEPLSQSSLWDRSVRDNVTHNKMTDQEVNRLRNDVLVPGSRLPTPLQGRVPVLLVQQSGKSQGTEMGSWGAGWDLLLPKAWGMAFWVPLVYRGVRIGGLRMSLKHTQNKGEPHFPHDYPDCPAGARFQEEQEAELLAKFRRRPPAKRTNYIKHGCLAPFRCPWQQLVEEWELIVKEEEGGGGEDAVVPMEQEVTPPQSNFTVLRNRKSLRQLSAWCRPTSSKCQRARNPGSTPQLNRNVAASLLSSHGGSSLVWIRLSLVTKGQPEQHALVCVPTAEDLQLVRKEPGCTGPQEPLHTDHFKSRVKRPRKKDHNKPGTSSSSSAKQSDPASVPGVNPGPDPSSSSSLTNPSSSCTSAPSVNPDPSSSSSLTNPSSSCTSAPSVNPDPSSSSSLTNPSSSCTSAPSVNPDPSSSSSLTNPSSSCTSALTLGLWPEPLPSVTSHCSRVTLGWVTQGDFSLSAGCGEALGLLSLTGLLHTLLRQPDGQRGLVLLRNPGSLQYRFAKINIEV